MRRIRPIHTYTSRVFQIIPGRLERLSDVSGDFYNAKDAHKSLKQQAKNTHPTAKLHVMKPERVS